MKKLLAICAVLLFCSALANATIIATLVSGPVPTGSNFAFNYQAALSADERLDPSATQASPCQGPNGATTCNNPYFTLYDIGGFQSASVTATGWGASIQLIGFTPSAFNPAFDAPGSLNVTFFYTGAVVHGPATFTGFQIVSSLNTVNPNGVFTSLATKDVGMEAGQNDSTIGPVTVPAAIPEPATIGLIGLGLLGIAAIRRKKTS